MKSYPVGAELFLADGQTDMIELISAFRYFVNAPKKYLGSHNFKDQIYLNYI